MTPCPTASMPRRPARPISWVSSPAVSAWKPVPSNLVNEDTTHARAGMLSPSDSVSVANTTLTSPSMKSRSTASFAEGSMPAWCMATPLRSVDGSIAWRNTRRSSASSIRCTSSP